MYLTINLLVHCKFELSNDQVKGSENRFFIFYEDTCDE